MKLFSKRNKAEPAAVQTLPAVYRSHPFSAISSYRPLSQCELELYESLREAVPIIDAAISKLVRLIGTFDVECESDSAQRLLDDFLKNVHVNGASRGIYQYIYTYFEQLLTYGTAVGETVLSKDGGTVAALYNASLKDIEIVQGDSPLELFVCRKGMGYEKDVCQNQGLISLSFLNPKAGEPFGSSVLRSLPFVSSILLKVFHSVGQNFERVGNVRFSVTYKPSSSASAAMARQRAQEIAREWSKVMRESDKVCDFVSVGDVEIKAIGSDNQILDCDVPIRHITEQIVSKLSVPPFMLGLSWSTTERMSTQQAEILMSELQYYRTLLTPVIMGICETFLRLEGYLEDCKVKWSTINLQDETELAAARLQNAQADQILNDIGFEPNETDGGEV
ncbi:MAG: serine/threonine protein phosphatase [Ruminococcus sp.]|nr:serine/threonine protein phosphatase [Ruminococcus sp.]